MSRRQQCCNEGKRSLNTTHAKTLAIAVALLLLGPAVIAQESLDAILARGYPAQWLIAGPFRPDVDGGLARALAEGLPTLGGRDYAPAEGGLARVRPRSGISIRNDFGERQWRLHQAHGSLVDLSSFVSADESVMLAGFYAQCNANQAVLAELQTPLGARVFMNGYPVGLGHQTQPGGATHDTFALTFRPGLNLFLIQLPLADYSHLSESLDLSDREFRRHVLASTPILQKNEPNRFSLSLTPIQYVGRIAIATRLERADGFTRMRGGIGQDVFLALYNPTESPAAPVSIEVSADGQRLDSIRTPELPPESRHDVRFAVPISGREIGDRVMVTAGVALDGRTARITSPISVRPPPAQGTVYVHAGPQTNDHSNMQRDRAADALLQLSRRLILNKAKASLGFSLGGVADWKLGHDYHPEHRSLIRDGLKRGTLGLEPIYGLVDERLVNGEVLVRNLRYGQIVAGDMFGLTSPAWVAWDSRGIAPQTPQILARGGVVSLVSNLPYRGLAELFNLVSPDGTQLLHRRKSKAVYVWDELELRQTANLQRNELLERSIQSDILVLDGAAHAALASADLDAMSRALPRLLVTGSAAARFSEDVHGQLRTVPNPKHTGRALITYRMGEILAQPAVKQSHTALTRGLLTAEKFATIAALLGAEYPGTALDAAWRQLLYQSHPDRLGFAKTHEAYLDTLAAHRDAIAQTIAVLDGALGAIAADVDTYSNAPNRDEGTVALVVYNPSSFERSDLLETDIRLDDADGITLLDAAGDRIAFDLDRLQLVGRRVVGGRLRFVAQAVPALGYRTYYVIPSGTMPTPARTSETTIENSYYRLRVDPARGGAIVSAIDKRTGRELVDGLWNEMLVLNEDTTRTAGGRELWTVGVEARGRDKVATVEKRVTAASQRLAITRPFLQGTLTSTITLYDGLPVIHCESRIDHVQLRDRIVGITWEIPGESNLTPIFGERFATVVAPHSAEPFSFRTDGIDLQTGAGLRPAFRWFGVGRGEGVRLEDGSHLPLGPTAVIYGDDTALREEAEALVDALASLGIPADMWPAVPPDLPAAHTDSTAFEDYAADLAQGTEWRLLLGGPDINAFTEALMGRLDSDPRQRTRTRLAQAGIAFVRDPLSPNTGRPIPTLIFAGSSPQETARHTSAFADTIQNRGEYRLYETAGAEAVGVPATDRGLAVLLNGSGVASIARDGTMTLLLAHSDAVTGARETTSATFRYALFPFSGPWRHTETVTVVHAFNEPLVGHMSALRLGSLPPTHSFLRASPDAFLVTSVQPANAESTGLRATPITPTDGVIVRGYQPSAGPSEVTLSTPFPIVSARRSDGGNVSGETLEIAPKSVKLRLSAYEIADISIVPGGGSTTPRRSAEPPGAATPKLSPYWKHNIGAAPEGWQPVTVKLEGTLEGDAPVVKLTLSNNWLDRNIEGRVLLTAPDGWRIVPDTVPFDVPAQDYLQTEILIAQKADGAQSGGVQALATIDGRSYYDVLLQNPRPLRVEIERDGNEIAVLVKNESGLPAHGFVEVIVSPDHWPELVQREVSAIRPGRAPIFVSPFGERRVLFRASGQSVADYRMVAKVAANGMVAYRAIPGPAASE